MLVVDASVAVKWFVEQEGWEEARALGGPSGDLIAPELILAEIASALWKYVRVCQLAEDTAKAMLARAPSAFDLLVPLEELLPSAFQLSLSMAHPVYDCFYFALARREGAPLVTADKRLAAVAQALSDVEARLLGAG
ncbi:MAG: type II toxin-antitoxin system VapC family toxin [Rhodomicrobium sp.]|nr:type II toxin-antitoxin system VapC family toxin [Rhodomicrobium sp.]